MNSQLREALQDLAKRDPAEQLAHLELLRADFGHSIVPVTNVKSDLRYNCVMYALNVHEHAELFRFLTHLTYGPDKNLEIFMDTGFLKMLIDDGNLQEVTAGSNCLAIYSVPEKITHIGTLTSRERVRSKWGTAHLYEHDLLECPYSYGEDVVFYTPIDPEVCVDRFFDYAKHKGAKFD